MSRAGVGAIADGNDRTGVIGCLDRFGDPGGVVVCTTCFSSLSPFPAEYRMTFLLRPSSSPSTLFLLPPLSTLPTLSVAACFPPPTKLSVVCVKVPLAAERAIDRVDMDENERFWAVLSSVARAGAEMDDEDEVANILRGGEVMFE
jgi:hypothetical protein